MIRTIFVYLLMFCFTTTGQAEPSCSEGKLSENALTKKISDLQASLKKPQLSSDDRKNLVKKALDEVNCQVGFQDSQSEMLADSPSRWKSLQYQDLLSATLKIDCKNTNQSKLSSPDQHLKMTPADQRERRDFVKAYCSEK